LIKQVLKIVHDGDLLSKGEIAEKMGIQESTLETIFSLLSSKGYLKKIDSTTETPKACKNCSANNDCIQKASAAIVYVITDKGQKYLEAN
jgi:predicted transcriptional regulator